MFFISLDIECNNIIYLQVALLRGGWNELLIAGFAHRSMGIQNGERRYQYIVDIYRYS